MFLLQTIYGRSVMPASALAIQQTFSRAALSYDRSASVQAKVAELLLEKLLVNSNSLIAGPVVEIGCGTGLVSSRLVKQFPERDFVFSDLSDSMLSSCRQRLEESGLATSRQSFLNVNAEDDRGHVLPIEKSALLISSFAMQWFLHFETSLIDLLDRLPLGGQMIFAVPIEGSFKEWRRAASILGVPCTINELPTTTSLRSVAKKTDLALQFETRNLVASFSNSLEFFKSLKGFGATTQLADRSISGGDMLKLIHFWDLLQDQEKTSEPVSVTYRVALGRYSK